MSSLTPPSNFPLVITTSSLQSALDVLLRHEFSALDLPIDPTDSLWERLEKDFQLTLGQLSALRNYVKSRSIAQSPTTNSSSSLSTGQVAPPPPDTKRPNKRKNSRKKVGEEKPASTSLALQAEQFGIGISYL
jgi:hypothetical protein